MLNERISNHRGFSLVELMVGVAVGLFVVLAASAIYLNATATGRDSAHVNRLNQDMRAIMDVMVADVRRAGFWSQAAAGNETPIGKRVWESPPVPTVSGRMRRLSQEWMTPSPGLRETPLRAIMNAGRVLWTLTSAGLG